MLGAWHLDRWLAGRELDFFVLFSSTTSLLGSHGQANHAAANAFLDQLAWQRRARDCRAAASTGALGRVSAPRRCKTSSWPPGWRRSAWAGSLPSKACKPWNRRWPAT